MRSTTLRLKASLKVWMIELILCWNVKLRGYWTQIIWLFFIGGGGPGGGGGASGQQDYTLQWIEYLRSQGQHQQADMLEQQMKASKGQSGGDGNSAPGPPGVGNPGPPGTNESGAPNSAPPGHQNGGGGQNADYSQQWADHYRAVGKIQEAEAIEAYIKAQKVWVGRDL